MAKTRKIDSLVWAPSVEVIRREKRWIAKEIKAISLSKLEKLARDAAKARLRSYSPYSHYKVGAAALDTKGAIHTGQNIEVASYSETGHAEEQSMKNAISDGAVKKIGRKFVRAIAVSHEGDSSPCGHCRQIMQEFTDNNALIVIADSDGKIRRITSLRIILPDAFGPGDLGIK